MADKEGLFTLRLGLAGASEVATGIRSAIDLIGMVTDKLKQLAKEAEQYRRVVEGHTISVREADEATGGLIDTIKLHQSAARLQAAGINANSHEFRAMASAAASYARTTGQDLNEAFERLTTSVVSSTTEGLRPFGIHLKETGTLAERQRRTIQELTRRYGEFRVEVETAAEAAYALENAWSTMWAELLNAAERSSGPLMNIMKRLTASINDVTNALAAQRVAIENMQSRGNDYAIQQQIDELSALGVDRDSIRIEGGRVTAQMRRQESTLPIYMHGQQISRGLSVDREAIRRRMINVPLEVIAGRASLGQAISDPQSVIQSQIERGLRNLARLEREDEGRIFAPELNLGEIPQQSERGGGGGRRRQVATPQGLEHYRQWMERINSLEQETLEKLASNQQRLEESARTAADAVASSWESQADREIKLADETAEAVEESYDRKAAAAEMAAKRMAEAEASNEERMNATIDTIDTVSAAFDAQANVFSQVIAWKKEEAEGDEETLKKISRAEGAFLVAFNAAKGATETALAAASIAAEDIKGGILHGLAAAAHYAAMGIAAAQLGSNKSGSVTTGTPQARSYGDGGGGRPTDTTTIVNVNGPVTSRRVNEELGNLERDADRRH